MGGGGLKLNMVNWFDVLFSNVRTTYSSSYSSDISDPDTFYTLPMRKEIFAPVQSDPLL